MKQQKPNWPDWLELLCSSLNCSPQFRSELDSQLAQQASILASINVREGFALLPTDLRVHYDRDNVAHLKVDLVAPDNWGYPVQISWRCEAHPDEQIAPQAPLPPSNECRIRVGWEALPTEELRTKYTQPVQPPFSISGNFSFEIDWQYFTWPDVWLELQAREDVKEEQIKVVEVALEQARNEWNRKAEEHGIIHNWSGLCRLDARCYELHIDFGSTDSSAMSYWLQALEDVGSSLSIARLIVRGIPK
jgi:hypothetical protein